MANALGTLFSDIANAIRDKNGETVTMKPAEFPAKIAAIETGGGSGGGSLPAGVYWDFLDISSPNNYKQTWIQYGGELYAVTFPYTGSGNDTNIYRRDETKWTQIITKQNFNMVPPFVGARIVYNGKLHFVSSGTTNHAVFDGTTITKLSVMPEYADYTTNVFLYNGKIAVKGCNTQTLYTWDEVTDTWMAEPSVVFPSDAQYSCYFVNVGSDIYCGIQKKLYKLENGVLSEVGQLSAYMANNVIYHNGYLYWVYNNITAYRYNLDTNVVEKLGQIPGGKSLSCFWKYNNELYLTACQDGQLAVNARPHVVEESE